MSETNRGSRSVRLQVRVRSDKPHGLKSHFLGCLREVVGYFLNRATQNPERFVYAGTRALVRNAKRYRGPKYQQRQVLRSVQLLEDLGVIQWMEWTRDAFEYKGWRVATHEELTAVRNGICTIHFRYPEDPRQRKPGQHREPGVKRVPRSAVALPANAHAHQQHAGALPREGPPATVPRTFETALRTFGTKPEDISQDISLDNSEDISRQVQVPDLPVVIDTESEEVAVKVARPSQPRSESAVKMQPCQPTGDKGSTASPAADDHDQHLRPGEYDIDPNSPVGLFRAGKITEDVMREMIRKAIEEHCAEQGGDNGSLKSAGGGRLIGEVIDLDFNTTDREIISRVTDEEFDVEYLDGYSHTEELARCCWDAVQDLADEPYLGRVSNARVMGAAMEKLRRGYCQDAPKGWVPVMRKLRGKSKGAAAGPHRN